MEEKLDTRKTLHRTSTELGEEVELRQPNRENRRQARSGGRPEPSCKSPRLRAEGRRSAERNFQSQRPRRSLRLLEKRDVNQRQVEHADRSQEQQSRLGYKGPPVQRNSKRHPRNKEESKPSLTSSEAHKNLERPRGTKAQDVFNRDVKCDERAESIPRIDHSKAKFVEAWLGSADDENPPEELDLVAANMALPLPEGVGTSVVTASTILAKSSVGPYDQCFRDFLSCHNVYVERENPSAGLVQRAKDIITRPRSSSEVDEATTKGVAEITRTIQNEGEEDIIQVLAPFVIPGMNRILNRGLESGAAVQWTNFAPVPLDSSVLDERHLSKPKPDKIFGYSGKAFTRSQLNIIRVLTDPFGQSYAMPTNGIYFPFIGVEFKSQAKGGTQYVAMNQSASAGGVVGYGLVELARRGLGLDSLDYNEPQFFSLNMDHAFVHVNVHWLAKESGQFSFHVENFASYRLKDLDSIREAQHVVKNILDWGRDERLEAIHEQLDAYGKRIQAEGALAVPSASSQIGIKSSDMQRQKGRKRQRTAATPSIKGEPQCPAPRLILSSAQALLDFIPPLEQESQLGFKKGEIIEFADANDENGWITGRIEGGTGRWGRVPVGYLAL